MLDYAKIAVLPDAERKTSIGAMSETERREYAAFLKSREREAKGPSPTSKKVALASIRAFTDCIAIRAHEDLLDVPGGLTEAKAIWAELSDITTLYPLAVARKEAQRVYAAECKAKREAKEAADAKQAAIEADQKARAAQPQAK